MDQQNTKLYKMSPGPGTEVEADKITPDQFYGDAKTYWSGIPATVDGMLGGFSHISSTDIAGSTKFIHNFIKGSDAQTKRNRAVDCGAGIGRITKRLLLPHFEFVDMVELNADFLKEAETYLKEYAGRVERFICSGLQDFTPDSGRYDVIWIQWVLGHLTDDDFIAFFQRCKAGLAEGGIIIVKENVAPNEKDFDKVDSSFTRPKDTLVDLLKRSGLKIVKEEKQKNFPKNIYDVWMFALQ